MTYKMEFDETGGYDCMYGGFRIMDANGHTMVVVDLQHFGQEPCDWQDTASKAKAEAVAIKILAAFNLEIKHE